MFLNKISTKYLLAGLFSLLAIGTQANEFEITFNEDGLQSPTNTANADNIGNRGTLLDNEYSSGNIADLGGIDVTFWAQKNYTPGNLSNNNADLFLTLFNTDATFKTRDSDLLVKKGNAVIIQEQYSSCSDGKTCTNPDDRAAGGYLFAHFSQPISMHSIGLVDIEDLAETPDPNNPMPNATIAFLDSSGDLIGNWRDTLVTGDGGYKVKHFGDSKINSGDRISYMIIQMQSSGGFNNLTFSSQTAKIPEPSSLALFALALVFGVRARKLAVA